MFAPCKGTDCLAVPFFFFFFGTRFSLDPLIFATYWLHGQLIRHVHCICSRSCTTLCVGTVQPAYNKHSGNQKSVCYTQQFFVQPELQRVKKWFLPTKCTSRLLLFGACNFWITYPPNFSSVLWWRKLRFKFISTLHTQAQRIGRVKVEKRPSTEHVLWLQKLFSFLHFLVNAQTSTENKNCFMR